MATNLNAALGDGRISVAAAAFGNIAHAKDMTQLSKETDGTRDGLYKVLLLTGNSSSETV